MDVSPERLVEQARERFELQDYYGAIHLLEEVIGERACVRRCPSLARPLLFPRGTGRESPGAAGRALALNPRYVEALIHARWC